MKFNDFEGGKNISGERIHQARTAQRMTQLELAAKMQVEGVVIEREAPDLLLVHGDTTTAFAAALCGFYRRVPVGHVEAGLRTGDLTAPFPE